MLVRGLRYVRALGVALLPLAALPTSVLAHAIVLGSDPTDGSTAHAPRQLTLHFNSRVEKQLCSASLTGPERRSVRLRQESSPSGDVLIYALPDLAPGSYQARWKVLSADGHLTEGAVRFVVDGQ
jgi:methionine-rich copper-binding protein CopC